ncbi:MAG: Fe-S cluster assembly protein SufD [SAR202 cluster bacterium]|nr:Fe-S cluster assembly protein SufD [SAR202 cluster bacterium]|tara:strand:+ start:3997 stop:5280 length:1284 start_codon:yes stop_codon:yes gene_type:complete
MLKEYLSSLDEQFVSQNQSEQEWLRSLKLEAFNTLREIGFPVSRKGNEKWKYTSVSPIVNNVFLLSKPKDINIDEIKKQAPWSDDWYNIVFVDGFINKNISNIPDSGISVSSLGLSENSIGELIDFSDDGFAALNSAFLSDGLIVSIEDSFDTSKVLNIIFYNSGTELEFNNPRLHITAEENSSSVIIESYVGGSNQNSLTNSVTEMELKSSAKITHYRLMSESNNTYNVGYGRVRLSDDTEFYSSSFFRGANIGRYDLNVLVDGERSHCDLKGLYVTSDEQHMDNFINIDHAKPNSSSNLFYKGILSGKSKAVFGGTVLVRKEAQKTFSVQSDKNLILSDQAEVDSKPALFIYADDVQCAHGATAGNIDEDSVFYMRSRGIDLEAASKLLIYGFADEIISFVEETELKNFIEQKFLESLPSYKFEF